MTVETSFLDCDKKQRKSKGRGTWKTSKLLREHLLAFQNNLTPVTMKTPAKFMNQ